MNMADPDAAESHTYGPRQWTRPRWPFYVLAVSAGALVAASVVVFIPSRTAVGYLAATIYSAAILVVPVLLFLAVVTGIEEHQNHTRQRMRP